VTINEHDRVSTGRDDESGVPQSSHALVDRLTAGEPYAVAFGGQGSAWLETLEELVSSAGVESELATLVGEAALVLEPVARELIVVRPIGFQPMQWVRDLAAEEAVPSAKHLTSAAVSVPGVLLTQLAAVRALSRQGMDHRNAARRGGRPLAGRAGGRGAGGQGRYGCGAACAGAADRYRGHAGGPSPRHLRAR
jgi:fatty acid synthase